MGSLSQTLFDVCLHFGGMFLFLADYINGDTYYKIKYPEHNLVRTKAQFKLLQSVEEHTPEMEAYIKECLG